MSSFTSPFASYVVSDELLDCFTIPAVDVKSLKIKKHIRYQVYIPMFLDRATSTPLLKSHEDKGRKTRHHIHVGEAGTLMVSSKKPFRVRFCA